MGVQPDSLCIKCTWDHDDLIHLLWRCPKLHQNWKGVVDLLNKVFQATIPTLRAACWEFWERKSLENLPVKAIS